MKSIRLTCIALVLLLLQSCAPKEDPQFLALLSSFGPAPFNEEGYFKLTLTPNALAIQQDAAKRYFDMDTQVEAQYQVNFLGLDDLYALVISDGFTPILYLFKSDGIPTEVIVLDHKTYLSNTGGITIGQHGFQIAADGTIERLGEVDLDFDKLSLKFRLSELGGSFPVSTQFLQPEKGIETGSTVDGEWTVTTYDHSKYSLTDGRTLLISGKVKEMDMMHETQLFLTCYSADGTAFPSIKISDTETGMQSWIQQDQLLQMEINTNESDGSKKPEFTAYRIASDGSLNPDQAPVTPRPIAIRKLARETPEQFLVASQFTSDGDGMVGIESTVFFQKGELLVNYHYSAGMYSIESYSFYVANNTLVDVIHNSRDNQVMQEPYEVSELTRHITFSESGNEISKIMAKSLRKELEEYDKMDQFDSLYAILPLRETSVDQNLLSQLKERYSSTLSAAVTPVVYDWD